MGQNYKPLLEDQQTILNNYYYRKCFKYDFRCLSKSDDKTFVLRTLAYGLLKNVHLKR